MQSQRNIRCVKTEEECVSYVPRHNDFDHEKMRERHENITTEIIFHKMWFEWSHEQNVKDIELKSSDEIGSKRR